MKVTTNMAALNTYNKLGASSIGLNKSLQKLSSGFRINSAADDAAGLMISEKMRAQIRGLDMATKNANDGMNLVQTAEGTVQEVDNMLQRMRELAVQAANDTNVNVDREALQFEIDDLTEEIDRIANQSNYNTRTMFNGGFNVGATYTADAALGKFAGTGDTAVNGPTSINVASGSVFMAEKSKIAMQTGIGNTSNGNISMNGSININGKMFEYGSKGSSSMADLVDTINSAGIGAKASFNTSGKLVLESNEVGSSAKLNIGADTAVDVLGGRQVSTGAYQGNDAVIGRNAAKFELNFSDIKFDENGKLAEDLSFTVGGGAAVAFTAASGLNINQVLSGLNNGLASGSKVELSNGKLAFTSDTFASGTANSGLVMTRNTVVTTGYVAGGVDRMSGTAHVVDSVGTALTSTGANFTSFKADGNKITIGDGDAKGFNFEIGTAGSGPMKISVKREDFTLQVGANKGEEILFELGDMRVNTLGVDSIKVNTASDAKNALTTIDKALTYINTERAKVGAIQNRLEHTVTSLATYQENLTASESQIRDTNMAKEMMNMTKNNILQQAGTAMLAQANQQSQLVLQLLG